MMRSLFSGVSGLRSHQSKMDVIGNNISNVNTVGFKSSSVNFSDVFYQTSQHAAGPNQETGTAGRNAMQIGLGSNVSSITTSIAQSGASQRTDNPFDLMIEGDSFFIVNEGGTNYFTKAGDFNIDGFGNLASSSGALVMGWQPDENNPNRTIANTVAPLRIMSPENMFTSPEATRAAHITGNIDSKDTQLTSTGKILNLTFFDNLGYTYRAQLNLTQDELENEYSLNLFDIKSESGLSMFVTKNDVGEYVKKEPAITIEFGGNTISSENIVVDPLDGSFDRLPEPGTPSKIVFNTATGVLKGVNGTEDKAMSLLVGPAGVGGAESPFREIEIDFSEVTMFSSSGTTTIEAQRGNLEGLEGGKKVGEMSRVGIDNSGKIYGRYDNGDSKLLGQIATTSFANAAGLEAVGNNMFAETRNSGSFDGIGEDPTQGGGGISTGFLEMSNVDLSAEFTQMITTQRGFQANSRIITTSDTMLEELINLKR